MNSRDGLPLNAPIPSNTRPVSCPLTSNRRSGPGSAATWVGTTRPATTTSAASARFQRDISAPCDRQVVELDAVPAGADAGAAARVGRIRCRTNLIAVDGGGDHGALERDP